MNKLKLYKVDIEYIKYLYQFDKRVQYNKMKADDYTKRRVYLGIVLEIDRFKYFVPLEHPRNSHQKIKNNVFIFKIHNGKYGMLGFNNMIPVEKTELINFDINKENVKYRQILISQYHFCNKHINEIQAKALATYKNRNKNAFFKKICCDFLLLEKKAKEYQRIKEKQNK